MSRLEEELRKTRDSHNVTEKKLLNVEIDVKKLKNEKRAAEDNEKKLKENITKFEKDLQDQKRQVL